MEITLKNLTLPKENAYFTIALIISLIAWLFLAITVIGIFYALIFSLFIWLGNGLLIAHLKSDAVLINEGQLPQLYATYKEVCAQLGVSPMPQLYIIQAGGSLNAFATRHAGRKFVVLFSDIVESYGQASDEIKFLLAHELAHIKCRHILKRLLIAPGLMLPLLGPAYSRACEASCDRYGAFVAKDARGALNALMALSGGKHIGKEMSPETFAEQYKKHRGFFISWHELVWGYPTMSQRVANMIAFKENKPAPRYSRNPFAYFFALFSFGGPMYGGSSMLITVVVIGMLAAIALPRFTRLQAIANDALMEKTLNNMHKAAEEYKETHGTYPNSLNNLLQDSSSGQLFNSYCQKTEFGYKFECYFYGNDFELKATPEEMGTSGTMTCIANKDGMDCEEHKFDEAEYSD